MENILNISSVNNEKYFFSNSVESNKVFKMRMGYYFGNKQDPENLFIKFQAKFLNVTDDNKIKLILENDDIINYFSQLEKVSVTHFKSTEILSDKKCKIKFTAFLKKKSADKSTPTILTLDFDNKTKFFTKNHTTLLLDDLEEGTEIKVIIELDSLVVDCSDDKNIYCNTLLKLKRLMSLKHIPVFTEKEIPEFPFSDDEQIINDNSDNESTSTDSSDESVDLDQQYPNSDNDEE